MQDTRHEILNLIRLQETATIQSLAGKLKLAIPTVRHHMAILERDGLVLKSKERGKVGKPHLIYSLSRRGEESFPKQYARLSSALIEQVKLEEGQEVVLDLMRNIARRRVHEKETNPDRLSRPDRIDLMLTIMEEEGFDPQLEMRGNRLEIRHLNCSYQSVAMQNPEVCELDVGIIQDCLGETIERNTWRPDGDRICEFLVKSSADVNQ